MCGIAGLINFSNKMIGESLIFAMTKKLNHRGPDDGGIWSHGQIAFGHSRLSIHDLTEVGHQPLFSHNQEWVIVFNGEIYNFDEIKVILSKEHQIFFKGISDTEVLINAISVWGIEKTLKKCVGMFAFAAYHIEEKKLYLARDRFGEKPLYYGIQNNVFAFSSELKALKPLKELGWTFAVDRNVLATYMRFGYVPTPYSIYKHIKKLEPGSYLEVDSLGNQQLNYYWQAKSVLLTPKFSGNYEAAVSLLEQKLKESVRLQMASDVPLGAFLSGGIDSSTVVALMQSQSSKKIRTFSIGFHEAAYNEAVYAKEVANHLGTDHTEIYVTEKDALAVIPQLPIMYDEPFADSSQIPTYLVSKIARSQVTVSLSGDAGDELFGGYNRYLFAETVKKNILDEKLFHYCVSHAPIRLLKPAVRFSKKMSQIFDKLMKLQRVVTHSKNSCFDLYHELCTQISRENMVMGGQEILIFSEKKLIEQDGLSYQEWMMYADSQTYMMDDILTKVDRAAMAVSLETRVPFLDHRLYEFAWSLPLNYKINNGVTKRILRDVLYRHVPQKLIDRPKMGFGIPLGKWLRNELKSCAEELLDSKKISDEGYLNVNLVEQYWQEHLSGKRNWEAALWTILMFQLWLENEASV